MKFKVKQEDISRALFASDKSLPLKASLPVLANVLISTSKDKLEVLSTNLETATKVVINCKVETEGKTTLPGKILSELVAQLPAEEILFEKLGEEMIVNSSGNTARLATMNPEEYPVIPKIDKGKQLSISASEFAGCAKKVEFCAAQDESRPILSGVLFEADKKKLSMVATDGYRLSYSSVGFEGDGEKIVIVIPAKTVGEIVKIISETTGDAPDEPIKIVVADGLNQVNFKIANIEFTSRLIEGEFPNWQKIIPSAFVTKLKISKADFGKQVKIASIFARDSGNIVRLKIENNVLTTVANTSQVGSNEAKVDALEMTGKGGEIAFNWRYLVEALSVIEDDEVNFEMIESLSPGRLTGANEKSDFFHIIMPVRLQT